MRRAVALTAEVVSHLPLQLAPLKIYINIILKEIHPIALEVHCPHHPTTTMWGMAV
jgi:hypothetical protein